MLCALVLGLFSLAAHAEEDAGYGDPKPAEMMPLAPHSLLLDMAKAGSNIVAVGERGHALLSSDGKTFVQKQTPTRATLNAVDFVDAKNGWAVGHDAVILVTRDGGESWQLQHWEPERESPLLDVLFLDAQKGFAIGAYGMMKRTDNGGETWEDVENDVTMNEWHLTSMARLNDGALLIAGEAGGMALSRDNGDSWVALESPYEGSYFGALPWGEQGALVFGLRGNAFVTEALPGLDAVEDVAAAASGDDMSAPGAEWKALTTDTIQSFMGGRLLGNGDAALVGVNGVIVQVKADGSVQRVKNDVTLGFAAVLPQGDGKLLVSGEGGTHHYSY
ncbi:MAG: YCF48-related protein [Nevskiales bacterium]